jgi:hypothetical protein
MALWWQMEVDKVAISVSYVRLLALVHPQGCKRVPTMWALLLSAMLSIADVEWGIQSPERGGVDGRRYKKDRLLKRT